MSHWTKFQFVLPKNHEIVHVHRFIHKHQHGENTLVRRANEHIRLYECTIEGTLDESIELFNSLRSKYSINPVILHSDYFGGLKAV